MARLTQRFFTRASDQVARALLGQVLVHKSRAGMIVETEAYLGADDAASHARFGETPRNRVMFCLGGISYVYLCYGVHHLFNVVTGPAGSPQAVLIRSLEPLRALSHDPALTRGPGKLTRALGITTRAHNNINLVSSDELYLERGRRIRSHRVARGPRIGVDYAGSWAKKALRFWVRDHPSVSCAPPSRKQSLPARSPRRALSRSPQV